MVIWVLSFTPEYISYMPKYSKYFFNLEFKKEETFLNLAGEISIAMIPKKKRPIRERIISG